LGLGSMMDKLPGQMSGGQRQRVALGRALVREPSVFLLDEPLSNLDAKLRHSVRTEIARLHRQLGTTMVYVTHDQVEAMTLGQRIVVLKDGEIQQIDTPMALYERPANLFVAGFLGSPAMNVLQGKLVHSDGLFLQGDNGLRLPLGAAAIDAGWIGRELAVGIRPEDLQPGAAGSASFEAVVEVIEPVGNEIFLNLRHGSHALVARVAPGKLAQPGQVLAMELAPDRLHFFDPASGLRLQGVVPQG
ncbi:MAG: ATP-binding cassette domain-containing protein, partial [Lysobacteraceae bacterium]